MAYILNSQFLNTTLFLQHTPAGRAAMPTGIRWLQHGTLALRAQPRVLRRGSGCEDRDTRTKLFTSRREVSLWQVARTIMGGWRAVHWGCYAAGQMSWCTSSTRQLSGDTMHVFTLGELPERQKGARTAVPVHTALGLCPTRTTVALRERVQASVSCSRRPQPGHGSLTTQPSPTHPSLENLSILQYSMALSRNSIHVATMREGAALLSYLTSRSCSVPNAELNPLLSSWTQGSQKAAVADLWIS